MLAGVVTRASASDPFNAFIWNRSNVLAGNGQIDRRDWFEWWYFKVVDPQTGSAYFFTYGVINPWDVTKVSAKAAAIVQVGDFSRKVLLTQEFPLQDFQASYDKTDVQIADNHATDRHIQGHLTEPSGQELAWDFDIEKVWGFNAMGWAMGVAEISDIYWYPAQAAATMTGWIKSGGQVIHFDHAPAYQDRNWGRGFPEWWTWLTANGFKNNPASVLAVGGGEPKLFSKVSVNGSLAVGLKHNGQEYVFRSTDLDKFQFDIHWGKWEVTAENWHGQRVEISASAPVDSFFDIPFFVPQGGQFHDYESLLGEMTVKIFAWDNGSWSWKLTDTLTTDSAGVEWGVPEPIDGLLLQNISRLYNTKAFLR